MHTRSWRILGFILLFVWIGCALLNMNRIRAGFLTSYGADLTNPAWLYIIIRSLDHPGRNSKVTRLFGKTPEVAAAVIFIGSAVTEISQKFWPHGIFSGTYDPFDIAAYALGISVCYMLDKKGRDAHSR